MPIDSTTFGINWPLTINAVIINDTNMLHIILNEISKKCILKGELAEIFKLPIRWEIETTAPKVPNMHETNERKINE